jgi:hypothetical protein
VVVTGPKGSVTNPIPPGIKFEAKDKQVLAIRQDDSGPQKAFHGLARALVANAVKGVMDGFSKELEIVGVGYRAESRKNSVVFTLGFSHPIEYPIPPGIKSTSLLISKPSWLSAASIVSWLDRWRPISGVSRNPILTRTKESVIPANVLRRKPVRPEVSSHAKS